MKPIDLAIDEIFVGDTASFERTWTIEDEDLFAKLSGNFNPLHTDEEYAQTTKFGHRLVYGMHVAILCSTLVGMYLPGKKCLCLRQDLTFKKPIFINDTVTVRGTVKTKSSATGLLDILISVTKGVDEVVSGIMTVQVLN
jgi:3-hydroxybutyryl-CoA dehydratase